MSGRRKALGKRKKKRKNNLAQKFFLIFASMVLVLCAASITYGFFLRHAGGNNIEGQSFRIEVLNGTGERGLAQKVAVALKMKGIDVFETGNAKNFSYDRSILISRKKNSQFKQLGKLLGCKRLIEQLKEDGHVDATLILGADYKKLKLGLENNSLLLE